MKLEVKLGSTYGILILAMLVTSTVAYLRMTQVNHIIGKFITEQVPVVYSNRGARVSLGKSDASAGRVDALRRGAWRHR